MENNSDHYNSLYVSLRELADWTTAKEAELESMAPIGGDDITIKKQQVCRVKTSSYLLEM